MLSRLLVIVIVLYCGGITFAKRNRLHPDSFKVPVGLLYQRGQRNLYNILKRSLLDHTSANSNYTFHVVKEHYTEVSSVMEKVCSLYSRGVKTIVAMTPPWPETTAYEQLSAVSNTYHIPLIAYSMPEIDGKPFQFILTIKPSTVRASLDLMRYYGWKNLVYVKDDTIESERFQKELESRASPYNYTIDATVDINPGSDVAGAILSIQENMTSEEELHVVLHTSPQNSRDIVFFYAIQKTNKPIHFLVVEPLFDDNLLDMAENSHLKLTTFNLMDPNNKEFKLLIGDRYPVLPEDVLLSVEAGTVLGAAFDRLHKLKSAVFNEVQDHEEFLNQCTGSPVVPLIHGLTVSLEIKRNVSIDGYSGNLEFDIHGRRRNYVLRVIETTVDGSEEIGTWSDRVGLKMNLQIPFSVDLISLKPTEERYIITSILEQPYLSMHGNSYTGFCKDLVDLLSNRLKFKYDLKLVDDRNYGSYNNNTGKWNGMIGELVDGKADMAVAPLIVTSRRSLAVEFTVPFQNQGTTLLLKKSKEKPSICFLVFSPFTWQLWIFIFSVYVVLGILYILICCYVDSPKHQFEHNEVPHWYTRSWPHRALLLACLVFTVMIASMYIANLGAILSYQNTSWSNTKRLDIKDVFKQSVTTRTPKMLLLRHGSTKTFLQRSNVPLYRRYWSQVIADPSHFVSTYQEGIQRVLESNGDTAIFLNSASGEYLSNENCDLQITSGYLNVRNYAIALPLNDRLRPSLNEAILSLRENGSLDSLYAKWWKSKCPRNHDSKNNDPSRKPIELMEMDGLFYMLTVGFGLIVLTIGMQLFYQKRRTSGQSDSRVFLYRKQSL